MNATKVKYPKLNCFGQIILQSKTDAVSILASSVVKVLINPDFVDNFLDFSRFPSYSDCM